MSTTQRELLATLNGRFVGTLREQANLWTFEYDPHWIANGFDLSPHLSRQEGTIVDGATTRPVQWFFDNLLPEEQAREVLAKEAQLNIADAFGLLAYYGKESAGAITLRAPGEAADGSGFKPLSDDELSQRIAKLPTRSLTADAPKRMSNGGAQHKLAVCVRDGKLFEPIGETPSTHILKPDNVNTEHWPHSVANEYFVMRLAQAMGINVPNVAIRHVPEPVYLIERFDRKSENERLQRLHIIDACQLLGLDRAFKYQQATVETLARIVESCAQRARARTDIATWALFNVLTGNADAHLKNLSFHVDETGIRPAPFYDLVSTESYHAAEGNDPRWPHTALSTQIGKAKTFGEVTGAQFLEFTDALGVTTTAAKRLIGDFTRGIEEEAEKLYQQFEAEAPKSDARAGQLRTLRAIRYMVLREMVPKLQL